MNKANKDIKEALNKSGVYLYELAERVGLTPNYFGTRLRKELPSDEKYKLFTLIQEIVDERKGLKADVIQSEIKRLEGELAKLKGNKDEKI